MTRNVSFVVALALGSIGALALHSPALGQINVNIGTAPAPQAVVAQPSAPPAYFYDGRYYRYENQAWFSGERHDGPWGPVAVSQVPPTVQAIPHGYKKMPPGHFKKVGPHPWCPPGQAKKGNC
jgi:hypothetical protein